MQRRLALKPGRKWWRFPVENPGEDGSAHACSSMKSEDGASPHLIGFVEVLRWCPFGEMPSCGGC